MPRFEIHKPVKNDVELPKDSRYVWINQRLDDDQQLAWDKRVIDFLEDKRETEGLELVMGSPTMKRWLFRWVR